MLYKPLAFFADALRTDRACGSNLMPPNASTFLAGEPGAGGAVEANLLLVKSLSLLAGKLEPDGAGGGANLLLFNSLALCVGKLGSGRPCGGATLLPLKPLA